MHSLKPLPCPTLPGPARPCPAWPCVALRCPALRYLALPCTAPRRTAMSCPALAPDQAYELWHLTCQHLSTDRQDD